MKFSFALFYASKIICGTINLYGVLLLCSKYFLRKIHTQEFVTIKKRVLYSTEKADVMEVSVANIFLQIFTFG